MHFDDPVYLEAQVGRRTEHEPFTGQAMSLSHRRPSRFARLTAALLPLVFLATATQAQYFGRNKVQYDRFDFRIFKTDHFSLHFYPAEERATADAARMAERWYQRHSTLLGHQFPNNPLIFYADPPDFQQSNVIEGMIEQGTGGVTEGAHDRVIMPFTGSYADNDHVLGHELVHVFQYRIAEATKGGLNNLERIPLWLIEGMAEYLSLGREDANTAMWLRDALRRNDLPTITQLSTNPRYFPYRYGQALWAYIGGVWGDQAVTRIYRTALEKGFEQALRSVTLLSADSLSARWHQAIRSEYQFVLGTRTPPNEMGRRLVVARDESEQNVSPVVSPDGKHVAFFSSRGLFGIDLYVADIATGRVVKQLTSVTSNPHFDALSFISSAGTWSPDGKRIAVVVYVDGDNAIDILDTESGARVQRIKLDHIGAMADPAWSPDGSRIAFSGLNGGISDLYVFDVATNRAEALTNDREAQLQPAWSPDGRTIAFVTDRGPETDFNRLTFGKMRLALMDVATREVVLVPRLGNGKAINPQFSPDGRSLYFVADPDGVPDIYRVSLGGQDLRRVTRVATGISGITGLSPTLSVARTTGELVFTVFDRGGFAIRALSAQEGEGTPVTTLETALTAGVLPPAAALTTSAVELSLRDALTGLPASAPSAALPYRSRFALDYVGGPSVGVGFGGGYGTGLSGGIALQFSDMLGDHLLNTVVQANGSVKDVGGQALYLDRSRRLNWGFEASHIPYAIGFASYQPLPPGAVYTEVIERVFFDNAALITQYPFSTTRRLEFSAGVQRLGFDTEVDSVYTVADVVVREARASLPSESALGFATGSVAFVGDNSFFGFTSPVAGGRYRFEFSPYFGALNFSTALADYRKYFFKSPFTLAFRAIHFGRYGPNAESTRLQPLYVGQGSLLRGYDVGTFSLADCSTPSNSNSCPEFDRLVGSRIAVANAELRIPLIGSRQLGLIRAPFIPIELAPFAEVGAAWSKGQSVSMRFDRNTPDRVPVFSAGVTARINLLGFAVGEVFWVHPFQRPGKGGFFGFQLIPGW